MLNWVSSTPQLPSPPGDYNVGFVDIMTEGTPEVGSYFRVFFPTHQAPHKCHAKCPQWTDQNGQSGIIKFMQAVLAIWPSWVPHTEFHLRDYVSLISPWLHGLTMNAWNLFTAVHGVLTVPLVHQAKLAVPPQGKFGVVVFSHGMGCSRDTYSKICYDLASQGLIVAAVEHRDGSACYSTYHDAGQTHELHHKCLHNRDSEYEMRTDQVNHRVEEICRVVDVLEAMEEGKEVRNVAGLEERWDLVPDWKGKIDMKRVFASGHSYGGNSALRAAAKDSRFCGAGVLDPWMFPGHRKEVSLNKPTLVVHTESFIHVNSLKILKAMLKDNKDVSAAVLRGAVHLSQTDLPLLFEPMWFGKDVVRTVLGMKAAEEPHQILEKNHRLLWGFLDSKMNGKSFENPLDWGDELAKS